MYDEDAIHTPKSSERAASGSRTAPGQHDEAPDATVISLHRLQYAFVELSAALNETLRGERGNAAACLQRVQGLLQGIEGGSPPSLENSVRQGLAPWQVRRVLAHIEANLSQPMRNRDLAALAHLSTFHFNVAFRNSVGNSPHEYIIRRRMERAQGLMLSSDKALCEIAAECGLADQPHFTRLFRRLVGESPAAWRRARLSAVDEWPVPRSVASIAAQER